MKTIDQEWNSTYEVQKSKFITYLCPISEFNQIEQIYAEKKKQFPDATHHCYAYRFEQFQKCSDDKEPNGTAGIPILSILEKRDCHNVLCIVIRYFGGIKLGAGGLVRAYTTSVAQCMEQANWKELLPGVEITIVFSYDQKPTIDYMLKKANIIAKDYTETVKYQFQTTQSNYLEIKDALQTLIIKILTQKEIKITQ